MSAFARRKGLGLGIVAAATVLLAASCSEGGRPDTEGVSGGGGAGDNSGYTIAMVTHETPGDTFWDKIKAGAEQAAANAGIDLRYSADPDPSNQSTLIQNAVDSNVDGIATTLATPDALAGGVKSATDAGIPVVAFNSGLDQYQEVGASMYFGSDETLAGATAGQRIADDGGQNVLCVIQAAGSVALEARCAGVKSEVPNTENIQVDGKDDSAVTSSLQAKLSQDPSIDYIVTLGAPIALNALDAIKDAGSKAKVGTFDFNPQIPPKIESGDLQWAIDQQPYLQGYEAVDSLWLYKVNGNVLGGGQPTLTGPFMVDKSNIAVVGKFAAAGTR